VTLVYQHELPNVPGKSIKGVLVEYGPGGYSPGHDTGSNPLGTLIALPSHIVQRWPVCVFSRDTITVLPYVTAPTPS
jgi:hypothetical protein